MRKSYFITGILFCSLLIGGCQKSESQADTKETETQKAVTEAVISKSERIESIKENGETITVYLPDNWLRLFEEETAGEIRIGSNEKQEPGGATLQAYSKKDYTLVDMWTFYNLSNTIGGISEDRLVNGLLAQRTSSENFTNVSEHSFQEQSAVIQLIETPNNYLIMVGRTNDPTEANMEELMKIADSVAVDNTRPVNEITMSEKASGLKVEEVGKDISTFDLAVNNPNYEKESQQISEEIKEYLSELSDEDDNGNELIASSYDSSKMLTTTQASTNLMKDTVSKSLKAEHFLDNYATWKVSMGWNNRMMVLNQDDSYDVKGHSYMILNPYNKDKVLLLVDGNGVQYDFMDELASEN